MTALEKLKHLEILAEAIVDTVREPLVLLSPQLRVLKVNRSFCGTFQAKDVESVGRPLSELCGGQWDIPGLLAVLDRVITHDEAFNDFEAVLDLQEKGRRVMLLNARLLRQASANVPIILLAIEDVTERRATEALLRHRTQELERSNRDLEEFAYVASHDLQEPLRMVVSYTRLLASRYEGKLGPEADEFIGFAVDGAKRMQSLIVDLLAYSRLDRSKTANENVDCAEALDDALNALSMAVAESGARIETASLACVRADYGQIVQLFQNLLGNALKFKSDKPLRIRVSSGGEGAFRTFRVEDNGIGIDPQHFERVFIIFERLHDIDVPGSGIGLAFCRKIIQRHGGRIWIEAGPDGAGTAFCFTLPASGETTS